MFPFKKKEERGNVPPATALAVILAFAAICIGIAAARWSWLAVDEQVRIRQDFNDLKSQQDQLKIQFDFWDQKVSEERAQLRMMYQLQQGQPSVNGRVMMPTK